MKKISSTYLFLILTLLFTFSVSLFNDIQILEIKRNVALNSNYPTETVEIRFRPNQDTKTFQHVLPLTLYQKLNRIIFSASKDSKTTLPYKLKQLVDENGNQKVVFEVQLKQKVFEGDEDSIFIKGFFINRYVNLPASIGLTEDQKLVYQDYENFYTPYKVLKQTTIYKVQKIISFGERGTKKGINSVQFTSQNTLPFDSQTHQIHAVNNQPQMLFTEVQKVIQISHWGNIAIAEHYKAVNVGPQLKGEFSRVQFSSRSAVDAKNAFQGIDTILPFQSWGLYYGDEIGNISTSRAYKDNSARDVKLRLEPRFSLVGGWKSNWNMGYNLHTKGFLKYQINHFETQNLKAIYSLNKILTEKYTIKVILPQGSTQIRLYIDDNQIPQQQIQKGLSFGYLDFQGRPTVSLTNQHRLLSESKIKITYQFENISILKKPVILFGVIFSILLLMIIIMRVKLEAFEDQRKKQKKQ